MDGPSVMVLVERDLTALGGTPQNLPPHTFPLFPTLLYFGLYCPPLDTYLFMLPSKIDIFVIDGLYAPYLK